ncbi:alpha/beta fold hydrolase [Euzebya pacifica]|uniref:alpha/beta fold hydrolase n=1 Tax=Euzebya pacifica TaxID=1608957 RepID=UPI0013DFCAED|nr:alpha/beta hydrolase [Euzebya pacifica]
MPAATPTPSTTLPPIVLVAGAWLGGWAWDDVVGPLRAAGHRVLAPTLPGMGDRRDEDHADIDVTAHIEDLAGWLQEQALTDVVLVGHSYAGAVATGAAAALPGTVDRLVYVDASVPTDDGPLVGAGPQLEAMQAWADGFGGRLLPLLPDEMLRARELYGADDLSDEALQRFREHASPFPLPCMTSALPPGTVAGASGIPRTFVRCTRSGPPPWWTDADQRRPEDRYVELDAGHWPMWSRPEELAAAILARAEQPASGG